MAPEVLHALDQEKRKGNYGTPADIWSLGSVLFFLCSHEHAFPGSKYVLPYLVDGNVE